jgi:hypothetical protein
MQPVVIFSVGPLGQRIGQSRAFLHAQDNKDIRKLYASRGTGQSYYQKMFVISFNITRTNKDEPEL